MKKVVCCIIFTLQTTIEFVLGQAQKRKIEKLNPENNRDEAAAEFLGP